MIPCVECGAPADAPGELGQNQTYPICAECLSKGWTSDPVEIMNAIANDPVIKDLVQIVSPIQPTDL